VSDPKNWNATDAELADTYACDEMGFPHDDSYIRAIDVAAPPSLVFRWLAQLRVAPYSYDLLDNYARRSPPHLVPGLERLAPGQRIMHIFRIVNFEPDVQLTVALRGGAAVALMGDFAGTYRVRAAPGGSRLVAKILTRYPRGPYGALLRRAMPQLDLFMFRKQLETLKKYAERDAAQVR
jgi:hypothetical protein